MAFPFTHLVLAWGGGKVYEFMRKVSLDRYTWAFLLLGGILPDADLLLDWTLGTELHRTFSHSILFALIMGILVYGFFYQNPLRKQYAMAMAIGIASHLILDLIGFPGGFSLFWPAKFFLSTANDAAIRTALFEEDMVFLSGHLKLAVLDIAIGIAWIAYLSWKKKIQF